MRQPCGYLWFIAVHSCGTLSSQLWNNFLINVKKAFHNCAQLFLMWCWRRKVLFSVQGGPASCIREACFFVRGYGYVSKICLHTCMVVAYMLQCPVQ